MGSVDLYCERTGGEIWAEPVNALTNISFLIAAWAAWHSAPRSSALTPGIALLVAIAVAIGLGSFAFHTLATGWARALDVVPILVFQLVFLWLYGRYVLGFQQIALIVLLAAFLGAGLLGRQFPMVLNGSLAYAPALLTILALGVYHWGTKTSARFHLLGAAGLFAVSLAFRSIDDAVCTAWPYGTHFLWHLANGLVVYLAIRTLVLQRPALVTR